MNIEELQFLLAVLMITRSVLGLYSFLFQGTVLSCMSYFMFWEIESNKAAQRSFPGLSINRFCPIRLLVSVCFVHDFGFQISLISTFMVMRNSPGNVIC